jgi:hypothetical protein
MMPAVIADTMVVVLLMSTGRHVPVAKHHSESAVDRRQHEPCGDERP